MAQMQTFECWMEGYAATGEHATAQNMGEVTGFNFADACIRRFKRDRYFNAETLSIWSCGLFPSEAEARESFG